MRISVKNVLLLVGLILIVEGALITSGEFKTLDMKWQFLIVAALMGGCGIWLGTLSPQTVENALDQKHIGIVFPAIPLAALVIRALIPVYGSLFGTLYGIGLTAAGFAAFWISAIVVMVSTQLIRDGLWSTLRNLENPAKAISDFTNRHGMG